MAKFQDWNFGVVTLTLAKTLLGFDESFMKKLSNSVQNSISKLEKLQYFLPLSPYFVPPFQNTYSNFWLLNPPYKKIYYHTIMNFEIHCQKAFATKAVIPSPLKSQIFSLRSAYTNFWHRPLAATPPNPTSIECMLKDLYLSMNLCEFFSNFWESFLWFLMRQNKSWYVISKM